jgi:hypothetical protein
MKSIEHKYHPFKVGKRTYPDSRDIDHYARVYELLEDQGRIVKQIKLTLGPKNGPLDAKNFEQMRVIFEKDLKLVQKHLGKFLPQFEIAYLAAVDENKIPKIETDLVEEIDKSEKVLMELPENSASAANAYMVMDKVIRPEGEDEPYVKKAFEFDDFFGSLGELYKETFKDGRGLGLDLKHIHFIFGHTKSDPVNKLYFIDLYPRMYLTVKQFKDRVTEITSPYKQFYNFPKVQKLFSDLNQF